MFWRTWVVVVTTRSAQFVEPFLPVLLLAVLSASPGTTAAVLLVQQAAATLGYLSTGRLVGLIGHHSALRIGLAVSAAAAAVLATANQAGTVAVAAATYGAGSSLWKTVTLSLVPVALGSEAAASHPARLRSRAFGLIVLASNAGAVLSAAAGAAGVPVRLLLATQAVSTTAGLLLTVRLPRVTAGGPPTRATASPATAPHVRGGRWALVTLVLAVAPSTALMFQAFSALAVALPADRYRVMVLVNAVVLVVGQPLVAWFIRRVSSASALGISTLVLGTGIAAQAMWPAALAITVAWSLAELVVITVPSAVVAGLAPHARAGFVMGRFAAAQGTVAAVASFIGPVAVSWSPQGFAIGCLVATAAGVAAVGWARQTMGTAMRQPVNCPCGAFSCSCDATHVACLSPSPVISHSALALERG